MNAHGSARNGGGHRSNRFALASRHASSISAASPVLTILPPTFSKGAYTWPLVDMHARKAAAGRSDGGGAPAMRDMKQGRRFWP